MVFDLFQKDNEEQKIVYSKWGVTASYVLLCVSLIWLAATWRVRKRRS